MSAIMVSATLGLASAIITESAISFLGLGFPPDIQPGASSCLMPHRVSNAFRSA